MSITQDGAISIVRFDRGMRANALSLSLMRELTAAARSFEGDHETSAVVLMGRDDSFSYGFDLKDAALLRDVPDAERREAFRLGARMCEAWARIPAITISAIEGRCIGGGFALAVSTDLRIVSEETVLSAPEVARGLNMSWGSVPRITNLIGPARAKRMIALAEEIDAARAVSWGLAEEAAPAGYVLEAAMRWAERAAQMPPMALRMCKESVNAYADALAGIATAADYDQFAAAFGSADAHEEIEAFLQKRPSKR